MKIFQRITIATTVFFVLFTWGQEQSEDILVQALKDEMQRTLAELKDEEENSGEIYFVSYRVVDTRFVSKNYELGGTVASTRGGNRTLEVDLRVGSYEVDQSNFMGRGVSNRPFSADLPIEDDYDEIRRIAWRLTDSVFKSRINAYAQKQTALANQSSTEERDPDFTKEEAFEYRSDTKFDDEQLASFAATGKDLSALFKGAADIYSSRVTTTASNRRTVFLNSEGSFVDFEEQKCQILTTASTQNENGQELRDFRAHIAIDCSELPDTETMISDVRGMISSLQTMRLASELDEVYFGPIMFEGQAAAQFMKTYLISKLSTSRPPLTANPGQFRPDRNSFMDRIGARIASRQINVVNDPTMTEYDGRRLIGSYPVDLEGVPPQRTLLVEQGRLQTMLTTRTPVDDFRKSNGSTRWFGFGGGTGIPGNVLIEPEDGLSAEDMKEELWQLLVDFNVDFGVVVRQISSPNAITGSTRGLASVMEAYKVYPDGREEMLAPVEILDITDRTLRDIVAVSEEVTQFDTTHYSGTGTNSIPVSIVAPSFIIEELGVRKVQGSGSLPPVVPHPYSEAPSIEESKR
ncbi:MAG: hypothetical protein F4227_08635 [Gammaproteobacteria bacterium]|nr:hypothetical protein [Gammaproteobacteria bacterium]MYF03015.1 hypothetical protein [Gammaproteobacteria bacterium]MYI78083.1 hypothetical protein [Gammaproteobacteria bacterium]